MSTRNSIIRFLFFVLLPGVFNVAKAQPVYSWAKYFDNLDELTPTGVTVDAAGNVYTTGYFSYTADFDPGTGTQRLTAKGDNDFYITKSDASGNLLWAKSIGGERIDQSLAIKADAAGNVYVTGFFRDTVDFDPGPGEQLLIAQANSLKNDIFILKLDASGNYAWAKSFTGTNIGTANAITIDASGNVYTTGSFTGIVDFDPGAATYNLDAGSGPDIFILKLDADGNYVWVKNIGEIGFDTNDGLGITVDALGNVYTTGFFSSTVDFDPGTGTQNLTAVHYYDSFILKLDATGNYVWVKQIGGFDLQMGSSIAVDASGNVYTTGVFRSTVDFDPGADVHQLTTKGDYDVYVSKLDAAGNYVWAVSVGGTNTEVCQSLALDNLNNVYLTGAFTGTVDFDPGTGTHDLTPVSGSFEAFILKLNASGEYQWATNLGSSGNDVGTALIVTGNDNIYTVGAFEGTVDFDFGSGTQEFTTVDWGAYVLHLVPSGTLPLTLLNFTAVDKDALVQLQWQTSQEENTALFTVERSTDGKKYEAIGSVTAANNNLVNNYTFRDVQPVTGTAFYRLKMIDKDGRFTNSRSVSVTRRNSIQPLQVSPNPAKEILYVQATGMEAVQLQITDANGRIWQQQHINLNGKTATSINIQALPAGVYYVLVKGKQTQLVQPFLKQ